MATAKPRRFKNEAEEAEWWAKDQESIAERFEKAKAAGKLGRGTVAQRLYRNSILPAISSGESRSWINTNLRSIAPVEADPCRQ